MKQRKAFTLIELAVSMTAGASILVMTIGFLHQSMALAKAEQARSDQLRRADWLAAEFRKDVHLAIHGDVTSSKRVELHRNQTMTSYEVRNNIVTRQQSSAGKVEQQDTFKLAPETNIDFLALPPPLRIQLTVSTRNPVNEDRRIDRQVTAVIGRLSNLQIVEKAE